MANGSDMNVALRFQADVSQARAELKALRADAEAVGQGAQKINTAPIDKLSGSAKQAGNASKGMGAAAKTASAETKALADASAAATAAAQAQGKAVSGAAKANQAAAISAKQHAQAMRMLPMQMTDITVGLSTGQSPFMVMMQQGGQLKDMFGGIAPAAKAVGGSVMGMVNPLTVTAAAVAVLIAGYAKGSKESDAFNQSIVMTGNAVGSTTSQLAGMATRIDGVVGTTYEAAQALAALASTGQVSSKNIEQLATTAVRMERVLGQAVSVTVEQFNELGRSPVEASRKLNESYNYLTASVYAQIKALVEQRKEDEAAELAQKTFSAAMDERTAKLAANAGTLEKAWRGVRDVVRETWDAILAVGRPQTDDALVATAEKQVDFLRQKLAQRQARGLATGDITAKLAAAEANLESVQGQKTSNDKAAEDKSEETKRNQAAVKAIDAVTVANKAAQSPQEKLNAALSQYRAQLDDIRKTDPSSALLNPAQIAKTEAALRKQYLPKTGAGPKSNPVDTAYQTQLQTLQQARAQAEQGLANAQDNVGSSTDQAKA
ncbi:phage tail length tape measure family protein, partial [Comamonas suwonensis]